MKMFENTWTQVQLYYKSNSSLKQEEFSKGGRRFLKLKKMGGDEETILKHKIKAREKNRLTNKKPTLDTMIQCSITILWI